MRIFYFPEVVSMRTNQVVEEVINLYSDSFWKKIFSKIRFWDAPYLKVEKLIPKKGYIVDLGCGEGFFANFLALSCPKRSILGVDVDKKRIVSAQKGLKNTKFILADVTKREIPKADCIVMFHLLHHLSSQGDQEILLRKSAEKLKIGGKLIIVEALPGFSIKFLFGLLADLFLVPWLFERRLYSKIFYRKKNEWRKLLNRIGYKVSSITAQKGMPFSHIILICQT